MVFSEGRTSQFAGQKIGVLMGGMSSEREISIRSGKAVAEALNRLGYRTALIDANVDVALTLRREGIEVAFVALHGRFGEDGGIQGLLEWMRIPYTGSGVLASALGMNKIFSRDIFITHGIPVPPSVAVTRGQPIIPEDLPFGFPMVVKPAAEGSSVGVTIVNTPQELSPAVALAFSFGTRILVEKYIAGREIHVGILGEQALGAIEIRPKTAFYDYTAKYVHGMSAHIFPAPLPEDLYKKLLELAYQAHTLLGCNGMSRVDLLLDTESCPYVLEVNTLPGMTEVSLLPEIAKGVGISFDDLVTRILQAASLNK